jgi:hypothetical protein
MSAAIGRPRPAPLPGREVSTRWVKVLGGLFGFGVALGLVALITDVEGTSSGQSVAVANGVHVLIGATAVTAGFGAYRRDPERVRRFLVGPFTERAWHRLLDASLSLPLGLAEILLALAGRRSTVAGIERWRIARTGDGDVPWQRDGLRPRSAVRLAVVGLVTGIPASLAALIVWFMPLRAGQQVFAAFDPDFTRDAWGGPSYLGASVAHWMDGVLLFYLAMVVIRWLVTKRLSSTYGAFSAIKTPEGDDHMTK